MDPLPKSDYDSMDTESLLQLAREANDNMQQTEALEILKFVQVKHPSLPQLYELMAEAYTFLEDEQNASIALHKLIEIAPNNYPLQYFQLAQLYEGNESVHFYKIGISLLESSSESLTEELKSKLSSAYSSIAEIYMTDLWY